MEMNQEDFDHQFRATLDAVLHAAAGEEEVGLQEFYHVACVLENLSFFGPFLYDLLQKPKQ
jgi:hypothetical protein